MGTRRVTVMRAPLTALLFVSIIFITVCEAYNIDRDPIHAEKRGYRDPDDPRNLFATMYGGVFKRSDPDTLRLTPEMYEYLKTLIHKRAIDRDDPRNLFHNIYGGVFRKR